MPIERYEEQMARGPATLLEVRDRFGTLPYMTFSKACRLRDFLTEHALKNCLELGFFHGLSSAYIAAVLHANGGGHLTTIDKTSARDKSPNIDELLRQVGLREFVTVFYEPRSYTWGMMKLIEQGNLESFDFCYIDGGHAWDDTGFAFFLVEKLIRPGGWILFDDLKWTFGQHAKSVRSAGEPLPSWLESMNAEELDTPQVGKVWELLVQPHPRFERFTVEDQWGFARKRIATPAKY